MEKQTPNRVVRWATPTLLGLWLLLYGSFTLVAPPLLDDADSVHAEAAREMLLRHDYVTLTADGVRYLEKAPLLYWLMAGFARVFGGHSHHIYVWAMRLPLAVAVLALAFALRRLGRGMFGTDRAGFYAALITLTSFGIFLFTRILIPDILLTLFVTLALHFFWRTLQQDDPTLADCAGMAAAGALAVLTKGLIGLLFPALVMFLYLACTRNLLHLLVIRPASQVFIFLGLAGPWHWLASVANPAHGNPVGMMPTQGNVHGFAWFYFFNDQFARYLNRRVPHDYDTVPLLLFWGLVLVWMMPWSAFLWQALRRVPLWTALKREPVAEQARPWLFCGVWAAVVLGFFSFSTRQEYYVLPAIPALALLVGAWLNLEHGGAEAANTEPEGKAILRSGRRIATGLLLGGTVVAAVALVIALRAPVPAQDADIAQLFAQNPNDYALSLGHVLDLRLRAMGLFRWPLIAVALGTLVGTAGNSFFRRQRRPGTANMFLAGAACTFLIASWFALVTFSPMLSSYTLARSIQPELDANSLLVVNGEYEDASTLNFYLQRPLHLLHVPSSDLWFGSFWPDAPPIWETDATLAAQWDGPRRIFVWTEPGRLEAMPGQVYLIAQRGGKQIVSNQPNHGGASF